MCQMHIPLYISGTDALLSIMKLSLESHTTGVSYIIEPGVTGHAAMAA